MSKILFSRKEVQLLQKNPNIQKVSERAITYTDTSTGEILAYHVSAQSRSKSPPK